MRSAQIAIEEVRQADGTMAYSVIPFIEFYPDRIESFISPSGTLNAYPSWNAMNAALAGEWVFRSASRENPSSIEDHRFTLSVIPYEAMTLPLPTINPLSGSDVRSPFTATFSPTNARFGWTAIGLTNPLGMLIEPGVARYTYDAASDSSSIAAEVYVLSSSDAFRSFITPATTTTVDPLFTIGTTMSYVRRAHANYVPQNVPEPSSLILCTVAAFAIARLPLLRRNA